MRRLRRLQSRQERRRQVRRRRRLHRTLGRRDVQIFVRNQLRGEVPRVCFDVVVVKLPIHVHYHSRPIGHGFESLLLHHVNRRLPNLMFLHTL